MKKKLRLQIESLRVEQFETLPDSTRARGTVHGLETEGADTCVCGIGPSAPHRYCVDMPDSWSCMLSECC
jgi:hypothetical protein